MTRSPLSTPTRPSRRWLLLAAAAVVAALAVLAAVLTATGEEGATDAAAAGTPASSAPAAGFGPAAPESPAASESPAGPPEAGPSEPPATAVVPVGADEPPPSRAPVALDEPAEDSGISARIVRVEAVEGAGTGPGNVAGPALRVTLRLDNGAAEPLDLGGVTVDLAWGAELSPASPVEDPSAVPLSGTLAPSDSAEGSYVFGVPDDERDDVTVSVAYRAGAPVLVLTGPAT
ncbi:MAG: hypothetical protein M3Q47_10705 [Actinomycetota bacterium]|nr:hypothetical protein [Actinomycetota bacterium]